MTSDLVELSSRKSPQVPSHCLIYSPLIQRPFPGPCAKALFFLSPTISKSLSSTILGPLPTCDITTRFILSTSFKYDCHPWGLEGCLLSLGISVQTCPGVCPLAVALSVGFFIAAVHFLPSWSCSMTTTIVGIDHPWRRPHNLSGHPWVRDIRLLSPDRSIHG